MFKAPLFCHPFELINHIIYKEKKPVGILNPSIQFAYLNSSETVQILGPSGATMINLNASNDLIAGLIATNSILLGPAKTIYAVQEYLLNNETSRTAAYLCSISKNCIEVENFFSRIKNSTVAVIGCGGIGSLAAMILAGAGVKKLIIVDPDKIEISNFNRQFFWTVKDVGASKVKILSKRLKERFPNIEITKYKKKVNSEFLPEIISSVDGVIFTADEPIGLIREIRTVATKYDIKFVSGGYNLSEAIISCSALEREKDIRILVPLSQNIAPSYGPSNVEIAGAITNYMLLLLGGIIKEKKIDVSWEVHKWPWEKI